MKNNLNKLIEYIDLVADSSSHGLAMIDIIMTNIRFRGDENMMIFVIYNLLKKL